MVDIDKELNLGDDTPRKDTSTSRNNEQIITEQDLLTYINTRDLAKDIYKYKKNNDTLKQILVKHSDIILDIEHEINKYERLLDLALSFKKNTLLPTEKHYKNNIFSISTYNKFALTDKLIKENEMHKTYTNLNDLQYMKKEIDRVPGVEKGVDLLVDIADKLQNIKKLTKVFDKTSQQLTIVEGEEPVKGEIPSESVVNLEGEKK